MPKSFARFLPMLAALLCTAQVTLASDIMVMNPAARASLTPTTTTSAAYLAIMNHGASDDTLLSLSTPVAASATIHETQMEGDVMKMRPIEGGVKIPAGATVELKSGASHVMLEGLKAPLKEGEKIMLDLVFEKAGKVTVEVTVGDAVSGHVH